MTGLASRLLASELLSHPVRLGIYDRVERQPGLSFLDLFHALKAVPEFASGLGYGSLSYHLQLLEKHGYLTSRKAGRWRRYYENGGVQGAAATALSILQTPPIPDLAALILDHPGMTQQALWRLYRERRACTRQAVSYHLLRLERHGLVWATRRGRWKTYEATPLLAELLQLAPVRSSSMSDLGPSPASLLHRRGDDPPSAAQPYAFPATPTPTPREPSGARAGSRTASG